MSKDVSHAEIADHVTIGHAAVIHGALIESGALIGIGAILLDNAVNGAESLVAAGSLVPADFVAPPRVLVRGSPAKVVRELTEDEWTLGRRLAERYVGVASDPLELLGRDEAALGASKRLVALLARDAA